MRALEIFKAFLAGFAATLLFHQPVLWVLFKAGIAGRAPYSFAPTKPFGMPSVISLAFWGGVWGIIMIPAISRIKSEALWWLAAIVFGAVLPTLVAGLVVAPLKHIVMPRTPQIVMFGLIVNGAWGLGTALLFRAIARQK